MSSKPTPPSINFPEIERLMKSAAAGNNGAYKELRQYTNTKGMSAGAAIKALKYVDDFVAWQKAQNK